MKKLALSVVLIGCGASNPGPEILPDLEVPPAPDNGVQVITPVVEDLQPGTDNEICTWTELVFDHDVDVRSTIAFQNEPPGHHTILFYTLDHQPPGTQRVCTDTDMASFRFVAGNGGNGELNEAPGALVYRIPAGAQLVVNHHYLNATDNVLRGQSLINVNFADPGSYIPSGSTAFLDTRIHVQPGEDSHDITCTADRELKLWYFAPHMHRWGTRITVDLIRDGQDTQLFDTPWADEFTFHPPEHRVDPSTPLTIQPGDQVKVHCEWNNDTGRQLDFGFEMCVAFGQFVDDAGIGNIACDAGTWTDF